MPRKNRGISLNQANRAATPGEFDTVEYEVQFPKRPLGIDVESGADGLNLYVTRSEFDGIRLQAQIVEVAGSACEGLRAPDIVKKIVTAVLPLTIKFRSTSTPERTHTSRVRQESRVSAITRPSRTSRVSRAARGRSTRGRSVAELNVTVFFEDNSFSAVPRGRNLTVMEIASHLAKQKGLEVSSLQLCLADADNPSAAMVPLPPRKLIGQCLTESPFRNPKLYLTHGLTSPSGSQAEEKTSLPARLQKLPTMQFAGFIQVTFENGNRAPIPLSNKNARVADLRPALAEYGETPNPEEYTLYLSGQQDMRKFEQELDDDDRPMKMRSLVIKDGQFGRVTFTWKPKGEDRDSDDDLSDSEYDDDEIPEAPTRALFRLGSIDEWSEAQIREMERQMHARMQELERAQEEAERIAADPELQEQMMREEEARILLLAECVENQMLIAEALHEFDPTTVTNFPDGVEMMSLQPGDLLLVSHQDSSGWWKGRNVRDAEGAEAYFPGSFVDVVAQPELLVRAVHDFYPTDMPEVNDRFNLLEIHEGDIILVTATHESGWWRGCNAAGGPEGHFPGDYTMLLAEPNMAMPSLQQFREILGPALVHGFLEKKGGVIAKKYKRFYFYLTPSALFYYKNEQGNPIEPVATMRLDEAGIDCVVKDPNNFTFKMHAAKRSPWSLKADSLEDMEEWVRTIQMAIAERRENPVDPNDPSANIAGVTSP